MFSFMFKNIWLFMIEMNLSEVPSIYISISSSRKLLDYCSINLNFVLIF